MLGAVRNGASRLTPSVKNAIQTRGMQGSHWFGPPRVRIPWVEKVTLATVMLAGVVSPSMYLLSQIKNYRPEKEE